LHQIAPYDNSPFFEQEVASIFKNGLHLLKYASVFGTLSLIGEINPDTAQQILDYKFFYNTLPKAIVITAVPKYVCVNGKKIEFSSYGGSSSKSKCPPLVEEYKKVGVMPEGHHFKRCLLDAVKGYKGMPTYYNVGAIVVGEEKDACIFYDSQTHMSDFKQENKQNYDKFIENKVNDLYKQFNTTNLESIIVQSYLQEHAWREEETLLNCF